MTSLSQLIEKLDPKRAEYLRRSRLITLAVDPGETTGCALFIGADLKYAWQVRTLPDSETFDCAFLDYNILRSRLDRGPDVLVIEDYRVYGWKAQDHAWNNLHTPQLIGAIVACANASGHPSAKIVKQMAGQVKKFYNDKRLKDLGYYTQLRGYRHARDAVRHGAYYLTFGRVEHHG